MSQIIVVAFVCTVILISTFIVWKGYTCNFYYVVDRTFLGNGTSQENVLQQKLRKSKVIRRLNIQAPVGGNFLWLSVN